MANYNNYADASNSAVRSYLTLISERIINSDQSKPNSSHKDLINKHWQYLKENIFTSEKEGMCLCAYCGQPTSLDSVEKEHLQMLNRIDCGLHLPGNVVPVCKSCNKRKLKATKYDNWKEYLIKKYNNHYDKFSQLEEKITNHINSFEKPTLILTEEQVNQIPAGLKKDDQIKFIKKMFGYVDVNNKIFTKRSPEWKEIILKNFKNQCAFCTSTEVIGYDYLFRLNRINAGNHTPENIIPICKTCNKREYTSVFYTWQEHLRMVYNGTNPEERIKFIEQNVVEKWNYHMYKDHHNNIEKDAKEIYGKVNDILRIYINQFTL